MSGALWVDDCKPCPPGYAVARTFDDALRLLRRFDYDELYLDHDLGEDQRTGYGLLNQVYADGRLPRRVICISWNPVGRERIERALIAYDYMRLPDGAWQRVPVCECGDLCIPTEVTICRKRMQRLPSEARPPKLSDVGTPELGRTDG